MEGVAYGQRRERKARLPGRELRLDLPDELFSALGLRAIHAVVSDIVAARSGGADQTHRAREEPSGRIAHQDRPQATAAVGADDTETRDIVQGRDVRTVIFQVEADAGEEDLVDEALEDRGKAHIPHGEREDERLRGQETLDVWSDTPLVDRDVVVIHPILSAHDGIEALGVQVAVVDLVSSRAKRLDDSRMEGGAEARFNRVGEENENAQGFTSALNGEGARLEPRKEEVLPGREVEVRIFPRDHLARVQEAIGVGLALEGQLRRVGLLHSSLFQRVAMRIEDHRAHVLMLRHDLVQPLLGREPNERQSGEPDPAVETDEFEVSDHFGGEFLMDALDEGEPTVLG